MNDQINPLAVTTPQHQDSTAPVAVNTPESHQRTSSDKTSEGAFDREAVLSACMHYVRSKKWPVFPLRSNRKDPAVHTGYKAASLSLEQIEEWWDKNPSCNVGIPTGGIARLLVIDTDEKNGVSGQESLAILEREYSPLPETLTASTANGGKHRYFLLPAGATARNRTAVRPGIDVRCEGGYVVAPPSVVDGKFYSWIDETQPIVEAPSWLLSVISSSSQSPGKTERERTDVFVQGSRNDQLFRFVMTQLRVGTPPDKMAEVAENANSSMCEPPLENDEVNQIVENALRMYADQLKVRLSDLGNSSKLAQLHGDKVRYVFDQKCWLLWNGAYWELAPEEKIVALARDVPRTLAAEAVKLPSGPMKTMLAKFAARSEALTKIRAMVELFKSEPDVGIATSMLDQCGFILPVKNGTIDLRTGRFSEPDRNLLVTQIASVSYDPNAKAPRWEAFLSQIMDGDAALVGYLQRVLGYVLTASTEEHCLFFLYGYGANGKSTFLNLVLALLGALGTQAASETLMDKRSGGGTSSDLARLRGKRFVAMSESDDGRHLNEAQVKSLTGGDMVVARELYQSVIHFTPTHKIFLASNHMPVIKSTDHGIWRRIRLIPFKVTIKEQDRNPNLENELRQELPGILNWALTGCLEWQHSGMPLPKAVQEATSDYKNEMDIVGAWIAENCVVGACYYVTAADADKSFKTWCEENYNISFSKNRFGRMIRERGFEVGTKKGRIYKGLTLNSGLNMRVKKSLDEETF